MLILGTLIIIASVVLGFFVLFGIGMTDGPAPVGWALWSQLWPAYLGGVFGVLVIAAKWLP